MYPERQVCLTVSAFNRLQSGKQGAIDNISIQLLLDTKPSDVFAFWLEIIAATQQLTDLPDAVLEVMYGMASSEPNAKYRGTLSRWMAVHGLDTTPACPRSGPMSRFYRACVAEYLADNPVKLV